MTLRRATLYIGGGTLLAAWFSSAASVSFGHRSPNLSQVDRDAVVPAQAITASVQAQARRLRQRLATAPTPQQPLRNPFSFRTVPAAASAPVMRPPAREQVPTVPPVVEPPLMLVGLAERQNGEARVRSAVISADGQELIMAEVGTILLGRYTVTSIGTDAVEMTDTSTGRSRRLALQDQ
jgi:hypothetical protein